jgi:hypothetical protein
VAVVDLFSRLPIKTHNKPNDAESTKFNEHFSCANGGHSLVEGMEFIRFVDPLLWNVASEIR